MRRLRNHVNTIPFWYTAKMDYLSKTQWQPRYFDIGVNFLDLMFQGRYRGKQKHPEDINQVISRAHAFHVDKMLITASSIEESRSHFELCKLHQEFTQTAGVHPCTVGNEFYKPRAKNDIKDGEPHYSDELRDDVDVRIEELKKIIIEGYNLGFVKAFGEVGLDYDRLFHSLKKQQIEMFVKQLGLLRELKELQLPVFLHMRAACDDFIKCLKPFIDDGTVTSGVVHSFTGSKQDLQKLMDLNVFHFSVNGCSLREPENLEVAAHIPLELLMIETDAPWCEVKRTHALYKYVSPYPNKFYPQKSCTPPLGTRPIKLNANLPFPEIKPENWEKHRQAVSQDSDEMVTLGHFAYPVIKNRNEPVYVGLVAEIMCGVYGFKNDIDIERFIDTVYENSCRVFKV